MKQLIAAILLATGFASFAWAEKPPSYIEPIPTYIESFDFIGPDPR